MSHQTGIKANEKLRNFFGTCRNGDVRLIKVEIEDEQLVLSEYKEPCGSWEDDYDHLVLPLADTSLPSYFLYRLDSRNEAGYEWLFITWIPDTAPVRHKMLYASTKATLKSEFGTGQIKDEFSPTAKEDVCLSGYHQLKQSADAPGPMTSAEEELLLLKKSESGVEIGIDTKHQTIQGVAFPISDDVIAKLFDFRDGLINYVQMSIDLEKEEINLETSSSDEDVTSLRRRVPNDHARYHLFRFKHSYDGDYLQSVLFIYSTPGYNCSVKERMLYSSCKSEFLSVIEQQVGIEIVRKLEIDDGKDLTDEFLIDEIHPKLNIHRQKFAKPKGPPNRGARRITKVHQEQNNPNSPPEDGLTV